MEILSLQDPPAAPARGLSRIEAFLVSLGIHLLAVLLFVVVPERLPEDLRGFLQGRRARAQPVRAVDPAPAFPERPAPPRPDDRIPLKFAYVKVPDDTAVPDNPRARLLSDKTRRARQEVPTPPDATRFSADPHSRGDSIDRVRPDPDLPAGADSPREAPPPAVRAGAETAAGGLLAAGRVVTDDLPPAGGAITQGAGAPTPPETRAGGGTAAPDGGAAGTARPGRPGPVREPEDRTPLGREGGRGGEPRGGFGDSLWEWRPGEFKFTFNNPAYLRGGSHGTLSFDTQDFPWGDYARQIYVIIRNNWLARIPLAAREGIRGYACWRFTIVRNGAVGDLRLGRTSSVPPFERAAADAIRASDPLPPLPEEFPGAGEGVTFCFYYNLQPGESD